MLLFYNCIRHMHFSICPEMMIYFGESRNACKKTLMLYNILQKKYFLAYKKTLVLYFTKKIFSHPEL